MEFLTTKQASELWGISQRRVAILCEEGRINGAVKAGRTWLMPTDAKKPDDARTKSRTFYIVSFYKKIRTHTKAWIRIYSADRV